MLAAAALTLLAPLTGAADEGPSMTDLDLLKLPHTVTPTADDAIAGRFQFARAFIMAGKPRKRCRSWTTPKRWTRAARIPSNPLLPRLRPQRPGQIRRRHRRVRRGAQEQAGRRFRDPREGPDYLDAGKGDRAQETFAAVLKQQPENAQGLTGLAYLDLAAGDNAAAKEKLTRAVASDPEYALALSYLGLLEMNDKDFVNARAHLEKALELDPRA